MCLGVLSVFLFYVAFGSHTAIGFTQFMTRKNTRSFWVDLYVKSHKDIYTVRAEIDGCSVVCLLERLKKTFPDERCGVAGCMAISV